jgi:membrane-bound inhibitor of C-type lysozyme
MKRGLLFFHFIFVFAGLLANDANIYQFGDVIINEVMADPVGLTDLAETEFVEIYNASGNDVSLSGWKFIYDSKESVLPEVILPSGKYAVLYRSGHNITVAPDALSFGMEKFPSALANTGKTIGLKSSEDLIIDEITYPKATQGKSWERSDDGVWYLSTDEKGGTPGAANSPFMPFTPDSDPDDSNSDPDDSDSMEPDSDDPDSTEPDLDDPDNPDLAEPDPGSDSDPESPVLSEDNSASGDVIINEVMADPVGLTELPETEYVEIYNISGKDVSLSGWNFIYDGKETVMPEVILPSGKYAVLYRAGRNITVAPDALSLGVEKFPSALANTSKTTGLKNSKGVIIDEVIYPKATRGKSWERSDDGTWHLSTDEKGGTPGVANSTVMPSEPGTDQDQDPTPDPTDPDDPNPGADSDPNPPILPDNSVPGDIVINEVMADPIGLMELPETEYVEIYNISGKDVSLSGWNFIYDGKETVMPEVILLSGKYAVLYRSGRNIMVAPDALSLGMEKFPSALANTSKTTGLKNSKGVIIDEVIYPKATRGKSWERSDDGTWYLSTDEKGGTPGAVNSTVMPSEPGTDPDPDPNPSILPDNSVPGDIVINEVMADPIGLTELPETEYVEIYNASGKDVSLSGWNFIYDSKETVMPEVILPSGKYAVLYRSGRNITVASDALSFGMEKFPSALANTSKTTGLKNSKGVMISEITYPKATRGKSWERSDDGTWHLSTDEKGGTPGAANSLALLPEPNPGTDTNPPADPADTKPKPSEDNSLPGDVIINEVMADPAGLTELPATEYVEIYNASGKNISLSGWKFVYDGKGTALPDIVLPAGGYAVLYRSGRDIQVAPGALSLGMEKFPSALANTGKTIGLENSKGVMIDELAYPKAIQGKSYERTDDGTGHLSTDEKGGTPGAANSPDTPSGSGTDPDLDLDPPLIPDNSLPGDVIINEVMADPVGLMDLPETEYVEIYNTIEDDVSLSGWKFVYDDKEADLPGVVLSAGGYAVLYRSGRSIVVAEGALLLEIDNFPSALANTGKTIGLKNSKGVMIDELTYPKASPGEAHERSDDGTWHLSTDEKGGTPGAVNSPPGSSGPGTDPTPDPEDPNLENPEAGVAVAPREIVINEILPDPFAGGSEYVELYNRSDRSLPLSGLAVAVRRADGSLSTHYPLSDIKESLSPEGYAVLTKSDGVADFYFTASPEAVHEAKLPVLNNEGATIVLFRAFDEIVIDEVSYSEKWHDASVKNVKGVSLERINPERESQDDSNWTSATADAGYGTPGYRNSQYKNGEPGNDTFIAPPEYIPGFDYYVLAYRTDKSGYRCRAEVYATNGKKMAEILNNRLISQEGELRWDGRGTDNGRLSPGVYLFYAELYHSDGDCNRIKKAFLVK